MTSDEERPIPWEEDIKNVDALPITPELLKGFGFDVVQKDYPAYGWEVFYKGKKICEYSEYRKRCKIRTTWNSYEYFHKVMDYIYYLKLNIEWKGIDK